MIFQIVSSEESCALVTEVIEVLEEHLKSKGWGIARVSTLEDEQGSRTARTARTVIFERTIPSYQELRDKFIEAGRGCIPPEMCELDPETFEVKPKDNNWISEIVDKAQQEVKSWPSYLQRAELRDLKSPEAIKAEINDIVRVKQWLSELDPETIVLNTYGTCWTAQGLIEKLDDGSDYAKVLMKALLLSLQQEAAASAAEAEKAVAEASKASEEFSRLPWDDEDQYLAGGSPISDEEIAKLLKESDIWEVTPSCISCGDAGVPALAQGPTIRPVSPWAVQLECKNCGLLTTHTKSILAKWLGGKFA